MSIHNATFVTQDEETIRMDKPVPESTVQNLLIEFVRDAPSTLRSFRSDLTAENIAMLRLERPEIDFLN